MAEREPSPVTRRAPWLVACVRRSLGLVRWLTVVIALSCSGARPAPVPGAHLQLRDFHFKSGLRLVAEEDHTAPVVGVINLVGVGATSDPPGKEGLAHLVEHLTFRARQSGRTVRSLFTQAGAGYLNAETAYDSTNYAAFGPRDAAFDFLLLEMTRIVDPLAGVDENAFALEREVVRNELRQRAETFVEGALWEAIARATYPSTHTYSRAAMGNHASLDRLTLDDARAFVAKHYRPSNMTLVLTGDITLKKLEPLLAEAVPPSLDQAPFDVGPPAPRLSPIPLPIPDPPPATGMVTIEGSVTAPELYLSWSVPRSFGDTSHLGRLAASGIQGAINHAESTDNDVIGGSVSLWPGALASTMVARVLLREGSHPEKSAEFVLNGLVYNWLSGSTPLTFERRIARIATRMLLESEDITRRGVDRAEFTHFTGAAAFYGKRMEALSSLNQSQLQEFYEHYLNRDRARAVLVRPIPPDRAATGPRRKIAVESGPSENVVYDLAAIRKLAVSPGLAQRFQSRTLENGLLVQVARHGTTPIVTIGLDFRGGRAEEAENGAAALAWSLATPGSPLQGSLWVQGGFMDRSAQTDGVTFTVQVGAERLDRALAILADYLSDWRVRRADFEAFKRYALGYERRERLRPDVINHRNFVAALFGAHPFGHVSEVPEAHLPDLDATNQWIATTITPARGVLAIVGDIDPIEAQRAAESAFRGWSGKPNRPDPPPLDTGGEPGIVVTHRPAASQATIRLGCRLPAMSAEDVVRAQVLSTALGYRFAVWREMTGSTYGLGTWADWLRGGTGVLYVEGAVENGALRAALRSIREELTALGTAEGAEIDRGRWVVASRYNLGLATTKDLVEQALRAARRGFPLASIDAVPDVLSDFKAAPLIAALNECPRTGVLSITGDRVVAARAVAEEWLIRN